jgi:hypothetical protein
MKNDAERKMAANLVRRDQFNITPQGIIHKPTDAAFTLFPGDPFSGTRRAGRRALANEEYLRMKFRG